MSLVGFMKKLLQKPAAAVMEEKITEQSVEAVNAPEICAYEYRFLNAPVAANEVRLILLQESDAKSILYDSLSDGGRRITPNELQMLKEMAFGSIMNNKNEPPSSKFHIMRSPRAQMVISRAFTVSLRSKSRSLPAQTQTQMIDGIVDSAHNVSAHVSMNSVNLQSAAVSPSVRQPVGSRRCSTDSDYSSANVGAARGNNQSNRSSNSSISTRNGQPRATTITVTNQNGVSSKSVTVSRTSSAALPIDATSPAVDGHSKLQPDCLSVNGSSRASLQLNGTSVSLAGSQNGSTNCSNIGRPISGSRPNSGSGELQRARVAVSVLIACDPSGEQMDEFLRVNAARIEWTVKHFYSWFDLLVASRLTAPRRCGVVDDRASLRRYVMEISSTLDLFLRAPRLRLAWHSALLSSDESELQSVAKIGCVCPTGQVTSAKSSDADRARSGSMTSQLSSTETKPQPQPQPQPSPPVSVHVNDVQRRIDAADAFMRQFDTLFNEYERKNRLLSAVVSGVLLHHRTWLAESLTDANVDAEDASTCGQVRDGAFGDGNAACRIVLFDHSNSITARFAEFLTYFIRTTRRHHDSEWKSAMMSSAVSVAESQSPSQHRRPRVASETSVESESESGCGSECTARDADADVDVVSPGLTPSPDDGCECECESASASSEPPASLHNRCTAHRSPNQLGINSRIRNVQRLTGSFWATEKTCLIDLDLDSSRKQSVNDSQYNDKEWSVHAYTVASSDRYVPLVPLLCTSDRDVYEKARAEVKMACAAVLHDRRLVRVNVLLCDLERAEVTLLRHAGCTASADFTAANGTDLALNFRSYLSARKRVSSGNSTSQRSADEAEGTEERVLTAAPIVSRTLDALHQLSRARLPADFCVRFLENKLLELANRSRTVARLTESVRHRLLSDQRTSAFQCAALRSRRYPHTLLSAVSKLTGFDTSDLEFMLQLNAGR